VSGWTPSALLDVGGGVEFAVGDVHGHARLLEALLAEIRRLADGGPRTHLTFLGDCCDRGPDSRRCFELVGQTAGDLGVGGVERLLGNHEQRLRFFLSGDGVRDGWAEVPPYGAWFADGGAALLESYGVDAAPASVRREALAAMPDGADPDAFLAAAMPSVLAARLRRAMAPETLGMLGAMRGHRRAGNVLFVHAGIDPAADVGAYLARAWDDWSWERRHEHWCWVRRAFLDHRGETFQGGLVVVHGHCVEDEVMAYLGADGPPEPHRLCHGRINLDAGSYRTGRAAAVQIEDGRYRVLVADGGAPRPPDRPADRAER